MFYVLSGRRWLLGIGLLLAGGAALTWLGARQPQPAAPAAGPEAQAVLSLPPAPDPLGEYRLQRARQRAREAELLEALRTEEGGAAAQELLALWRREAAEERVERALEARGYAGVLAHVSAGRATLLVPARLAADDAAAVGELVSRLAEVPREGIVIVDSQSTAGEELSRDGTNF